MLRGNLCGTLMRFVSRFTLSVDHLQLPALRSSDVKNTSSLRAKWLRFHFLLDWSWRLFWTEGFSIDMQLLRLSSLWCFLAILWTKPAGRLQTSEQRRLRGSGPAHQQEEARREDTSAHIPVICHWGREPSLSCGRAAAPGVNIKARI